MRTMRIGDMTIGDGARLLVICGPCVIESLVQCVDIAKRMSERCGELGMSYMFKGSFDKANRSSIKSDRGPGLDEGLRVIERVREEVGVLVTTDIHESCQGAAVGEVVDVIQVPAFLCRQTDLLAAAAGTGKAVNVKKGQFLSPGEMVNVVTKLNESGCDEVMLTERGTFFGYNRLVNDFVGVGDLMELGCPVCFDVTHSTQEPGGGGTVSGGRPDRAGLLAKAAVAAGVDAVFIETHADPSSALSDAATMLELNETEKLLGELAKIRRVVE